MKKFICIALCLISAVCALALTACGEEVPTRRDEVYGTYTCEENI